jgi:hypothetical protein
MREITNLGSARNLKTNNNNKNNLGWTEKKGNEEKTSGTGPYILPNAPTLSLAAEFICFFGK